MAELIAQIDALIGENTLDKSQNNKIPVVTEITSVPTPLPMPEIKSESKIDMCYLVRDKIYPTVPVKDMFKLGLQLDSDVFSYGMTGSISKEPIFANRNRLVTNDSFANVESINEYLIEWGKIPTFLEIKTVVNKGYGAFTKRAIGKLTFLGYYSGQYRTPNSIHSTTYGYTFVDNEGQTKGYIDAENMTFANWTRFINDGDAIRYNIEYAVYNNQVYIFTIRDIVPGEELIGNYGEEYWKNREEAGVKKYA